MEGAALERRRKEAAAAVAGAFEGGCSRAFFQFLSHSLLIESISTCKYTLCCKIVNRSEKFDVPLRGFPPSEKNGKRKGSSTSFFRVFFRLSRRQTATTKKKKRHRLSPTVQNAPLSRHGGSCLLFY